MDLEHGGRLASLVVDGLSLLVDEEPDPLEWGCYLMAPYAGRVRHGRFVFDGREHVLPLNRPPHAQHGTVYDVPWRATGPERLVAELGPPWPWHGEVEQRVHLTDGSLTLEAIVRSHETPMPVLLGWHPWFRRDVGRGAALELDVRPVEALVLDDEMIPTGQRSAPPPPPWDGCFTELERPPRLCWPGALDLEITSSATCWVVYSRPAHAVCVEPQTAPPGALGSGQATVVEPGAPLTAWMRLSWDGAAVD